MGTNPIVATSIKGGWGFFQTLKVVLAVLLFGMVFVNCAMIIIETGSVKEGGKYLGYSFLWTTEKIQVESQKIIDRGYIFPQEDGGFLHNLWEFMKNTGNLFSSLIVIYVWLWIIAKLLLFFPLADNSKTFTAWVFALLIFFLFQIIIILAMTDKPAWTPFLAFKDLGKAILISIQPLTQGVNKYDGGMNNITDKINNITI